MGTEAGAPPIKTHVAFVPAVGEAADPPIEPATFVPWRGRRPRRLVATRSSILEGHRPRCPPAQRLRS